ncbi:9260_t:CDS:2 [Acaulospora colombiana]|uniref:9260_t:CDS:1 n=1 Tax=Acaulospora colombiana TaxID=27376 RepID=A0ACA9MFY7_9GLOM|nr:9260_t:CDS:2 [Acaulospora colombiana]
MVTDNFSGGHALRDNRSGDGQARVGHVMQRMQNTNVAQVRLPLAVENVNQARVSVINALLNNSSRQMEFLSRIKRLGGLLI